MVVLYGATDNLIENGADDATMYSARIALVFFGGTEIRADAAVFKIVEMGMQAKWILISANQAHRGDVLLAYDPFLFTFSCQGCSS